MQTFKHMQTLHPYTQTHKHSKTYTSTQVRINTYTQVHISRRVLFFAIESLTVPTNIVHCLTSAVNILDKLQQTEYKGHKNNFSVFFEKNKSVPKRKIRKKQQQKQQQKQQTKTTTKTTNKNNNKNNKQK